MLASSIIYSELIFPSGAFTGKEGKSVNIYGKESSAVEILVDFANKRKLIVPRSSVEAVCV